jgi:hypothetical protein
MNHAKIREWLNERGLTLEETFVSALDNLVDDYKKKRFNHREDLYSHGDKTSVCFSLA